MSYDILPALQEVQDNLRHLHDISVIGPIRDEINVIGNSLTIAISSEVARRRSEVATLAIIVGKAVEMNSRLNDEANGGLNPRSPTGDDYLDLWDIVVKYGEAAKTAGEIFTNLMAAADVALTELHRLDRACDDSGVIFDHLKPLAEAFIAAGGTLDWYPPPRLVLAEVREAMGGLLNVIGRMNGPVPPEHRDTVKAAVAINNRLSLADGSLAL